VESREKQFRGAVSTSYWTREREVTVGEAMLALYFAGFGMWAANKLLFASGVEKKSKTKHGQEETKEEGS
jgi:hypothetical protein